MLDQLQNLQKLNPILFKKLWNTQSVIVEKFVHMTGFNPHESKFEDVQEYLQRVRSIDPEVFFNLVKDLDHFERLTYKQIKQPTLIIHGSKDKITPLFHAKMLKILIPNSKIEHIEEGSHVVQMDFPQLINDLVEDFILSL